MMKLIKMCLILVLMLTLSVGYGNAEWIGADPAPENADADPDNDVVAVVVIQNGAEIIAPYTIGEDGIHVMLIGVEGIAQADFQFAYENKDFRRSPLTVYNLRPAPAGCQGIRVFK